jgi:predicted amidophosphoribosyltransferase
VSSTGGYCAVCGQVLDARRCPNRWCRRPDRAFSVVFSVGLHQGALRHAISRYKYRGERGLADVFASMLADFVTGNDTWFEEFDLITAVPSYRGAGAHRGWDAVGTVVERLAGRLGPSWSVQPGLLAKRRETPAMTGLGWPDRQRVATGPLRTALAVNDPSAVAGRQILVVDDVLTEGGTMREVARALRGAGAGDVAGLVLARPAWSPAGPRGRGDR